MKHIALSLAFSLLLLLPLSSAYTISSLSADSPVSVGEVMKVTAVFENTGPQTYAVLEVDVYSNGEKVTELKGDRMNVPVNGNRELFAYFMPQRPGTYILSPRVEHGGGTTTSQGITVTVTDEYGAAGWTNHETVPLGLGMTVIAVVFVSMFVMYMVKSKSIIAKKGLQDKRRRSGKG